MFQRLNRKAQTSGSRGDALQTPEAKASIGSSGLSQAVPGVTVDVKSLLAFQFKHKRKKTSVNRRSGHNKQGNAHSLFKGRGMTFSEVREYQAGDDARAIDWRVTARRGGQAHTKLYQEEREQPVLLVVDQRSHLFFGTQRCFKSVLACEIAALFAWQALSVGDRVSHLIFTDDDYSHSAPKSGLQGVMSCLKSLVNTNQSLLTTHQKTLEFQQSSEQLVKAIETLNYLAKPGAHIILISDFLGLNEPKAYKSIRATLNHLAKHTNIYGLFLYDRFEHQLPATPELVLSDGANTLQMNTYDKKLRQAYLNQFEQQATQAKQLFSDFGCPILLRGTHQSTGQALMTELSHSLASNQNHSLTTLLE